MNSSQALEECAGPLDSVSHVTALWIRDATDFVRRHHPSVDAEKAVKIYAAINGFFHDERPSLRVVAGMFDVSHEWVRRIALRVSTSIEQMCYPEDFLPDTRAEVGAVKECLAAAAPGVVAEINLYLKRDDHCNVGAGGVSALLRLFDHLGTNTHDLCIEMWRDKPALVNAPTLNCWNDVISYATKVIRASGAVSTMDVARHFDLDHLAVRHMLAPFLREVRHTMDNNAWLTSPRGRCIPRDSRRRNRYWQPLPPEVLVSLILV